MIAVEEIQKIIKKAEGQSIEYKAVLPPARIIGQLMCSFANSEGGHIILGVRESPNGIKISGLSQDFRANSVTHKAIDLLSPKPTVNYDYVNIEGKQIYVIKVEKSLEKISIEGKIYIRQGANSILLNPMLNIERVNKVQILEDLFTKLENFKNTSTEAKGKFLDHYQSVLNIIYNLGNTLYPVSTGIPTDNQEGKILIRILFSSCTDNFESYLSDLLYEIYLASPDSLKSTQQVTIKEVLDCADMQEFVIYWSKKKLSKLQRGSVKGFMSENNQIRELNVIDKCKEDEIEKILQIRHLYAHRNGIVDEKFLQYFNSEFILNEEHVFSVEKMIKNLIYLLERVQEFDTAAIQKYSLATLNS